MNGVRLGAFEPLQYFFGATDPSKSTFLLRNVAAGAVSGIVCCYPKPIIMIMCPGAVSAVFGSPFFLVKVRLQSQSSIMAVKAHYEYSSLVLSPSPFICIASHPRFINILFQKHAYVARWFSSNCRSGWFFWPLPWCQRSNRTARGKRT
jgi:hypothetical protein